MKKSKAAVDPKPIEYAPRGVSRRRISLRLPDDLGDWLERVAAKSGRSVTAELADILADAKRRGWSR